jgi:hypothetical protein
MTKRTKKGGPSEGGGLEKKKGRKYLTGGKGEQRN